MPSPDQLAHVAQHHHRIAVMVAIGASQIGMWICIWFAVFGRKKAKDPDPAEPISSGDGLRQKSPAPPTTFSVQGRRDGSD